MDVLTPPARARRIFGNRTLNMRSIRAIGYDMDYTLIHYRVEEWEQTAFDHTRDRLVAAGWSVGDLEFDPSGVIRGLTIDVELGNLVKPTRFGYVIKAAHGTRQLEFDEIRSIYAGASVDLREDRWVFLNTLFSMSEASLFAQLVERLDRNELPETMGYSDLYTTVRNNLDEAHMAGRLKEEILADPERFVVREPEVVLTLQDQQEAGKRLLLITNSEWEYTSSIMEYAFDPHMPSGATWRDLFEAVIVSAAKPAFFTASRPLYRIVDESEGFMRPQLGPLERGAVLVGGCAAELEEHLGVYGDQILYVGDHLYSDVSVSKALLRWRTALILRELESEIEAAERFAEAEDRLSTLMKDKVALESSLASARLDQLRGRTGHADPVGDPATADVRIADLRTALTAIDGEIGPLAEAAGRQRNELWGPLMRSGNDKSLFARQVERYADVYTSRVSNFGFATPYAYLRAERGTLPHDG
ncbi:MAG: HAD-IG family 5'-nucleotidase [Acidimicrobiia bacterium]